MNVLRFSADPFDNIQRLQRAIQSSFARPFFGLEGTPSGRGVFPALNFFEDEKGEALVVTAEMPGVDRDSLNVETEENRLILSGSRMLPDIPEDGRFHRRERQSGEYRRVFRLPFAVDPKSSTARYENGILTIRLEKAAEARPRQIKVKG